MKKILLLSILFLLTFNINGQGFLKTSGKTIVDGNNNEVLLKGIGLGGWLLQEGYMLQTSSFANAEHEIRETISDLIGEEKTQEFYEKYWENYVREIDIQKISEWDFNSIRLPMHYNKLTNLENNNTYYEKGFEQIDLLLEWCKKYELYLILDLHGAPGGQSAEGISDYDPTKPSLWESETNKEITVKLWRKLAERYANETWIGGYDVINEPACDLGPTNQPLRELYIDITEAIREVDTNHIIFIEGNWYATTFTGLTPPWDDNMAYSFHKYWNPNDHGSIGGYLSLRQNSGIPLWLGETGENSNSWFADCVKLLNDNNIGWAWWPHKKIASISGPLSSPMLPEYQQLLNYWKGTAPKPSVDYAFNALMMQAEKLKLEECDFHPGVIDALIRQPYENSTYPFKDHTLPGRIYATDYDIGPRGYAYQDKDYENIGSSSWNIFWQYRNDGVDIEKCNDASTNGFNVGQIETGDWIKFSVTVEYEGTYDISIRYAANDAGGKILFTSGGEYITDFIEFPVTGGWYNWQTLMVEDIYFPKGETEFTARFFFGGYNINYFQFLPRVVDMEDEINNGKSFRLFQNFPNPFNPDTIIKYEIEMESEVSFDLYNSTGELIQNLRKYSHKPGEYELNFSGESLVSGVYFLRMSAKNPKSNYVRNDIIKMMLLK
ncbi:cellulase family glycosylhydrolase [Bacteroidota bacterium]